MTSPVYFHLSESNDIVRQPTQKENYEYVKHKGIYYYSLTYRGFYPKPIVKIKLVKEIEKVMEAETAKVTKLSERDTTIETYHTKDKWVNFFLYILYLTFPNYGKDGVILGGTPINSKHYYLNKIPNKLPKTVQETMGATLSEKFDSLVGDIVKFPIDTLNDILAETMLFFSNPPPKLLRGHKYRFLRYDKAQTYVSKYITHIKHVIYQIKTCNSRKYNEKKLNLSGYCKFENGAPYVYLFYMIQQTKSFDTTFRNEFKCVYIFSPAKDNVGVKPITLIMASLGFEFYSGLSDLRDEASEETEENEEEDPVPEQEEKGDRETTMYSNMDFAELNTVKRINRENRLTWRIFANRSGDNHLEYVQYPTLFFSIGSELYNNLTITKTNEKNIVSKINYRDPILTFTNVEHGDILSINVEGKGIQIREVVDNAQDIEEN